MRCRALACSAEERGDLLHPLKRGIKNHVPSDGEMRIGLVAPPDAVPFHLLLSGEMDAVEGHHFAGSSGKRSLCARSVVAADIDDQRVVELAHVLDGLDYAADLMVGVGEVGRIHFCLTNEQLLLYVGQLIPALDEFVRPSSQLGVLRYHPELLLIFKD